MDTIPPALARLQHMNHDAIGGRNALTPVMNRGEDAYQEWERRRTGKPAETVPYPQLQYLHQQAELAASQGMTSWNQHGPQQQQQQLGGQQQQQQQQQQRGYGGPPTSKLAHVYSQPLSANMGNEERRDAVMSSVRTAAGGQPSSAQGLFGGPSSSGISGVGGLPQLTSPPQAYTAGGGPSASARYAQTQAYVQQQQQLAQQGQGQPVPPPPSAGASYDGMYAPMQPDSFGGAARQVGQTAQGMPPSFYGAGVQGMQGMGGQMQGQGQGQGQSNGGLPMSPGQKDRRAGQGQGQMDTWNR
jgi:dual specificity protein kinase YAK1